MAARAALMPRSIGEICGEGAAIVDEGRAHAVDQLGIGEGGDEALLAHRGLSSKTMHMGGGGSA